MTFVLGGVFRMYIKFDEHYNYRAPDVCFHTIPFHPNGEYVFSTHVLFKNTCAA